MTSIELLTILNSIRDSYILEARAMGNKKKPKMIPPDSGSPAEKPLPFSSEKVPGRYQAKEPRKRKKNGLKRFLVVSAAAGILLAALAGRGTIAGWGDYFETFRNRTKNPYQYTQPADVTAPPQRETMPTQNNATDTSMETARILAYTNYFNEWMPGSLGSSAYSPYYEMKFLDLNGDGLDEMVIWESTTGIVYEVVTMDNGQTVPLYSGSIYKLDEYDEEMYLCQDNTLEKFYDRITQGPRLQEYYRVEGQEIVMVECIMQDQENRWYWSESGGASSVMWTEISESEAHAIQNSHLRVEVRQENPTSEEVKAQIKAEAEERLRLALENQYPILIDDAAEDITLSSYCEEESERLGFSVEITRYALLDMDGDSISECVVDFRFGENEQVMCLVLKYENGTIYATGFYYRQMYQLKSDGTFAASGGAGDSGWYRLVWENMSWISEQVSDEEGSESKPDAPWQIYDLLF